jgi:hypothetical protein
VNKILYTLLMTATLSVPVTLTAKAVSLADQPAKVYRDDRHHDTHEWNDSENQRYRSYLQEHHKKYRDFDKVKRKDQDDYWAWRHQH